MFPRILLKLVLILGAASAATGCSNACTALAEYVCTCRPNQPEQAACLDQVRLSRGSKTKEVTVAETEACQARIDTCTCEGLARGNAEDLANCGLTPPIQ